MLPITLASAALLVASAALPALGPAVVPGPPSSATSQATGRGVPGWAPPILPPVLVAPFDPPDRRWLPGHRGVDLAAGVGDPVRSAGAGRVTWAGPLAGRGVVVVEHEGGLRTTYEPVEATVLEGDRVEVGDILGSLGDGDVHCARVPCCLHWGLRRGEDYLDPWQLLHPGRPVLLPP